MFGSPITPKNRSGYVPPKGASQHKGVQVGDCQAIQRDWKALRAARREKHQFWSVCRLELSLNSAGRKRMENTKMRCRALRALKCQIKRIHDDPCKSWDPCVWADNLHRTQERICESTVSSSGRAIGSLAGAAMGQVGCFPLLSLPKTAAQCHTYTHHHTPTQTQTQNDTDTYIYIYTHTLKPKRSEESDSQTLSCGKRIQD